MLKPNQKRKKKNNSYPLFNLNFVFNLNFNSPRKSRIGARSARNSFAISVTRVALAARGLRHHRPSIQITSNVRTASAGLTKRRPSVISRNVRTWAPEALGRNLRRKTVTRRGPSLSRHLIREGDEVELQSSYLKRVMTLSRNDF